MTRIFVSYRRDDAQGEAGHLLADLRRRFGDERVFMDIAAIGPGEDFGRAITDAIAGCSVVLVIIGRAWLDARDARGQRRLDDAGDWVRLEVEAALQGSRTVVPVLVQGATMPAAESLPESMRGLVRRNAHELSARRWDYDVNSLAKGLEVLPGIGSRASAHTATDGTAGAVRGARTRWIAITAAIAAFALGAWMLLGDRNAGTHGGDGSTVNASAPVQADSSPKMATSTFGMSNPNPAAVSAGGFSRTAPYIAFARLSDDFAEQADLSDAELRRLAWTSSTACSIGDAPCNQAASQKIQQTLESVCKRKVGSAPAGATELTRAFVDGKVLGCVQSMQSTILDETLQRAKDAVRTIKPG